jgi:hypothetical protein
MERFSGDSGETLLPGGSLATSGRDISGARHSRGVASVIHRARHLSGGRKDGRGVAAEGLFDDGLLPEAHGRGDQLLTPDPGPARRTRYNHPRGDLALQLPGRRLARAPRTG